MVALRAEIAAQRADDRAVPPRNRGDAGDAVCASPTGSGGRPWRLVTGGLGFGGVLLAVLLLVSLFAEQSMQDAGRPKPGVPSRCGWPTSSARPPTTSPGWPAVTWPPTSRGTWPGSARSWPSARAPRPARWTTTESTGTRQRYRGTRRRPVPRPPSPLWPPGGVRPAGARRFWPPPGPFRRAGPAGGGGVHLVGGGGGPRRADAMLYGPTYLHAKAEIMEPIGRVLTLVDTRTANETAQAAARARACRRPRSRWRCCCWGAWRCSRW